MVSLPILMMGFDCCALVWTTAAPSERAVGGTASRSQIRFTPTSQLPVLRREEGQPVCQEMGRAIHYTEREGCGADLKAKSSKSAKQVFFEFW